MCAACGGLGVDQVDGACSSIEFQPTRPAISSSGKRGAKSFASATARCRGQIQATARCRRSCVASFVSLVRMPCYDKAQSGARCPPPPWTAMIPVAAERSTSCPTRTYQCAGRSEELVWLVASWRSRWSLCALSPSLPSCLRPAAPLTVGVFPAAGNSFPVSPGMVS